MFLELEAGQDLRWRPPTRAPAEGSGRALAPLSSEPIGGAPRPRGGGRRDEYEGSATVAVVTAILLRALHTAGDLQNGMSRALLLVAPERLRVLGAQLPVSLGLGASMRGAAAQLADSTQAALGRLDLPATTIVSIWLGTAVHFQRTPTAAACSRRVKI